MPTQEELSKISNQAERDLNSYEAKVGNARSADDAGVTSRVETKFHGATVNYDNPSTNAGYNRRVPPGEGGDLDDRGRQARGSNYEGSGRPESKLDRGGYDDNDVVGSKPASTGRPKDVLQEGADAVQTNLDGRKARIGGENFKGEDYYTPEDVPDSAASQGNVPPDSVTNASRD